MSQEAEINTLNLVLNLSSDIPTLADLMAQRLRVFSVFDQAEALSLHEPSSLASALWWHTGYLTEVIRGIDLNNVDHAAKMAIRANQWLGRVHYWGNRIVDTLPGDAST